MAFPLTIAVAGLDGETIIGKIEMERDGQKTERDSETKREKK